jgi:hypothetical protein
LLFGTSFILWSTTTIPSNCIANTH